MKKPIATTEPLQLVLVFQFYASVFAVLIISIIHRALRDEWSERVRYWLSTRNLIRKGLTYVVLGIDLLGVYVVLLQVLIFAVIWLRRSKPLSTTISVHPYYRIAVAASLGLTLLLVVAGIWSLFLCFAPVVIL